MEAKGEIGGVKIGFKDLNYLNMNSSEVFECGNVAQFSN